MNFLCSAAEPPVLQMPLEIVCDPAGKLSDRLVRIIQAAVAVLASPSAYVGRGNRIQHSPRVCLGIPIASRKEERHDVTVRSRAQASGILAHQTSRRSCPLSPSPIPFGSSPLSYFTYGRESVSGSAVASVKTTSSERNVGWACATSPCVGRRGLSRGRPNPQLSRGSLRMQRVGTPEWSEGNWPE